MTFPADFALSTVDFMKIAGFVLIATGAMWAAKKGLGLIRV